jgi:serine/threonine protein kinase
MPKVRASAFTAAELARFGAALRRGDVVRAVAKGDKQVVYTAGKHAVLPRLKYFVRGYREVKLGANEALQSAFADVLRQRRKDAAAPGDVARHKDASQDSDTSTQSTDSSSSGGATIDGSAALRRLDKRPAHDLIEPAFFSQPKVSTRTLKAYVSAGVLNLSLRELSSELSDKNSALHKHLVSCDYPFIKEFCAFVKQYEAGNQEDRDALRWQAHGGELPGVNVFLGVWARHSGKSPNPLAAVEGGNELNRIAAMFQPIPRLADLPQSCCGPDVLEVLGTKLARDLATAIAAGRAKAIATNQPTDREVARRAAAKPWVDMLAKKMAAELNADPDSDQAKARRICFAMSSGAEFRTELLDQLRSFLVKEGVLDKEDLAPDSLKEAIIAAYNLAVASLKSGVLDATGRTLTMDGIRYTHTRDLGKGGYCTVQLFTGPNGETLALKSPHKVPDATTRTKVKDIEEHADIFAAQVEEARIHAAGVAPSDRPRPVRTPDGVLRLILPYYPNGNCEDLGKTILKCLADRTLPPKAAMLVRRAVLADMAREVLRLRNAGLLHNDIKGANFCIDAKGRVHLIDYGAASMGPSRLASENTKAQNPRYVACEIEADLRKRIDENARMNDQLQAKLEDDLKKVDAGNGKNKLRQRRALNKQYKADLIAVKNRPYQYATYNQSADMWSLGVAAFELFGLESQYSVPRPGPNAPVRTADNIHDFHLPFEGTHVEVGARLTDFQTRTPDERKKILNLAQCGRKNPSGRRDDAMFAMLDPDPTTRITPDTLLKSRFLDDDELETPALRALIAALGSGDRKAIKKASSKLRG